MLGGTYLSTRDQLIELVQYTRALAKRSSTDLEEGEAQIEDALRKPFRVVCFGERGVGKTAFAEKLLGVSLPELEVESSSLTIVRNTGYRVFDDHEDACEKVYSLSIKEFEVVEVSTSEELTSEKVDACKYLLEGADFVFWLLPAENPWVASTWDSIELWQDSVSHKAAIVLQQIDRRKAADIPMLLGHVKELAAQRHASSLGLYAASAQQETGIQECKNVLDTALNHSIERRRHLREAHQQVFSLLQRIEEKVDDRSRNLSGDQEYLQSIEAQIARTREEKVLKVKEDLTSLGKLLRSKIKRIMLFTRIRTGTISSHIALFWNGGIAARVESFLIDKVAKDAVAYAQLETESMRLECRAKWGEIRPHLENRLDIKVGDFDEDSFDEQDEIFVEGMEKATRMVLVHLKLRRLLNALQRERFVVMRKLVQTGLVLLILGALVGVLGTSPHSFIAIALAAAGLVLLSLSVAYGWKSAAKVNRSFREALEDAAPALRKGLQEGQLDRVRAYYSGFTPMFESMRRLIADARADVIPQQKVASQLYLRLKALEQEI